MATNIYMPALGMAQITGRLVLWHKAAGAAVTKGEPLMEIETDKTTVEIEAPASGTLANVTAQPGDEVPVGQVVALILAPGEVVPASTYPASASAPPATARPPAAPVAVTPVASRMAAELKIDLKEITPAAGKIQKSDVEAYLAAQERAAMAAPSTPQPGRLRASPKARRLGRELNVDLATVAGTGPGAAVLAADVLATAEAHAARLPETARLAQVPEPMGKLWRVMVERLTHAWTTIPQFVLTRDVDASRLAAWRARAGESAETRITYTDLFVKVVAAALRRHPRLNAMWVEGEIVNNPTINVGLAVAVEAGLLVPVIQAADGLSLGQIASQRQALVSKATNGRLGVNDLSGGTFTISNLGMYGVDAFTAIVNPPQAAILAVGRVADRVAPVNGQPAVRPMLTLSLTCDHRVVDGARAAAFLDTLASLIEEPLGLLA